MGPLANDGVLGHGIYIEGWIEPFHLVERADPPVPFNFNPVKY